MRFSQAFIPTLKEVPKDAVTPSHVFLLRGGFVRMIGAGIYEMLPLGMRVLRKIENIVRDEMDSAGGQEVLMPALLPASYYKESGRWDTFGGIMLKLKDRKRQEYALGPTHEEIITAMVRGEIKSYKQLPQNLYQIQMKYRDEARPRAGLLRCREFLMKDAYSFDIDQEGAQKSYDTMRETYKRIFSRLGLDFRIVKADSGAMGGSTSAEFQVLAQTGEDDIVACPECDYAANVEVAASLPPEGTLSSELQPREKVHTPNAKTIAEVCDFLSVSPEKMLKSIVYTTGEEVVLAVVRGDHEVNEIKLARHLGVAEVHLANEKTVQEATGASVGFAGPVGFSGRIVCDLEVALISDGVTGGNETDQHFRNVTFGRDFKAEPVDIRQVVEGDLCPNCKNGLKSYRGIEGGHIFILGTHYTEKMKANYLGKDQKPKPIVMGCYGIGVSRLMAAAIEQNHDDNGIIWPMSIAPYQVIITTLGKADDVAEAAQKIYNDLKAASVEVLLDDRNDRPGVKFADAELIGIPYRITIGGRGLKEGVAEVKHRAESDSKNVPLDSVATHLVEAVSQATKKNHL